jgi:hypothetical protein
VPATHARLPTPEERAAELDAIQREADRDTRRRWIARALGAFGSVVVGLYLMAWGLHLTDPGLASVAFWGGLLVGNLGVFVTLIVTYQQELG